MSRSPSRTWSHLVVPAMLAGLWFPRVAWSQSGHDHPAKEKPAAPTSLPPKNTDDQMVGMADHAMGGGHTSMDSVMSLHMLLSPMRAPTHADSTRALALVADLRRGIAKYKDVSAAERDGFRMFLPNVKNQRVYHFTSARNAIRERFRFDPEEPTSLLYKRAPDGQLMLIGAMYTMPKRTDVAQLDERVPLSIARWHRHVNWCLPKLADKERWMERRDGRPVFGPESPIATKTACDAVDGNFHESLLGWMLHANVFAGEDLGAIFGDEHGR
jgi:hypothetical protein